MTPSERKELRKTQKAQLRKLLRTGDTRTRIDTVGPRHLRDGVTPEGFNIPDMELFLASGYGKSLIVAQTPGFFPLAIYVHEVEADILDESQVSDLTYRTPDWVDEYPGSPWPATSKLHEVATLLLTTPIDFYDRRFRGRLFNVA